jgi:hypothetical protein
MKSIFLVLLIAVSAALAAETSEPEEASPTPCVKPEIGMYEGACAARVGLQVNKSPYALHKWMACRIDRGESGMGGYSTAVFYSELAEDWENEMNYYLSALQQLLSKKHVADLQEEQRRWTLARERWHQRQSEAPSQEGTMYMALSAGDEASSFEARALELGCRVEKFTPRHDVNSGSSDKK